MIEVINKNWLEYFLAELNGKKSVYIISPFVTRNIVDHLLKKRSEKIKLITRYNLNDFRSKISSLSALKKLVEEGAEIKGIKNLHSKVYLFDNKSIIIGSANFTSGGFFNNYEYGIKTTDNDTIIQTVAYFESLWNIGNEILTLPKIEEWEKEIEQSKVIFKNDELSDYGKIASIQGSSNKKYFIKLFGKNDFRVSLDYTAKEEIIRSHCHWALTFSGKKGRPRKYNDGDIVYMASMLYGTDYAIFGKGIALKHIDKRDVASETDIDEIDWKKYWPIYIRVKNTCFIDSSMGNCPKMSELINSLKYDSFDKTQSRHLNGEEDLNVWASLRQQADVQLSELAAEWLENKFQEAKMKFGTIPQEYINNLYSGTPSLQEIISLE
jgi:HKD family nuclease